MFLCVHVWLSSDHGNGKSVGLTLFKEQFYSFRIEVIIKNILGQQDQALREGFHGL